MTPQQKLIQRLLAVFGSPKTDDPETYLREFERALSRYSEADLIIGGNHVIDNNAFFPRPAEVVSAIREHHETKRVATVQSSNWGELRYREPSGESKSRVDELVKAAASKLSEGASGKTWEGSKAQQMAVDAQRPGFEEMQRNSPNPHLHQLTEVSRRIVGDRE